MSKLLIADTIELIVIIPLIILSLDRFNDNWKKLLLFVIYYFIYSFLLAIPNWYPELRIIESRTWNWSGKIYSIIASLLFYFKFRKAFIEYDYVSFKLNKGTLNSKLMVTIIIFVLTAGIGFFLIGKSDEKLEYLLFQFTMPGLDEELAFRGIILGLLSNSLKPKVFWGTKNLGNPALVITSILFGLGHSFVIDNNWNFHQNWIEFINAFVIGLILGWITIKSGNILRSILTHNLINTLPKIIFWI